MCGITGIILKQPAALDIKETVMTSLNKIRHRGPDGEGVMVYQNIGFGHRRLAIIDTSSMGHQPMVYRDGEFVITYNGEIYNYIELRKELEQKGHIFCSHTDTEVILAAYAEWGDACVNRFNGMWAFAILDKPLQRIFCSRDRFGVKPFYYLDTPELFAFSSEIKPLLPFLKHVEAKQSLLTDFILTSVADHTQDTFFKNIFKLQAGHNLVYDFSSKKNTFNIDSYYKLQQDHSILSLSENDAIEFYMQLLQDAVGLRLRADVAVGTCLSGGLDSSTVAALAAPLYSAKAGREFTGVTAVSEQESNNEAAYAKQVIDFAKMNWLQVCPTYSDFVDSLPHVVLTQEEPFGSTSLTMQYFVMKTAREHGIPVLLDGQGGDETLLGYEKYYGSHLATTLRQQGILAFLRAIKMAGMNNKKLTLPNAMKHLLAGSLAPLRFRYYLNKHRYLLANTSLPEHLSAFSKTILNTFELQRLEIEQTNLPILLRYEDKNSMAHSIETRLPFLDYRVVEASLSFPEKYKIQQGWTKWLLRAGMQQRMPDSIVWRKNKFGFEAPEEIWLKNHQKEMLHLVLNSNLLLEMSKKNALKTSYQVLDYRSQWRLYSIALWEQAFGISR